jgi:prevent-host-death family protein
MTRATTVSAMEARKRFGQILEEAFYCGETFVIERSGRAMAVVVPIEFYERMRGDSEITLDESAAEESTIRDVPSSEPN